jgi:hypothetical protein|tara:strand:- start:433 stop:618 length:186 start_codon:yes stop_codon:yes gene_type:complete
MEAIANAWNTWDKAVSTTTFSVLKVSHGGGDAHVGLSEFWESVRGAYHSTDRSDASRRERE